MGEQLVQRLRLCTFITTATRTRLCLTRLVDLVLTLRTTTVAAEAVGGAHAAGAIASIAVVVTAATTATATGEAVGAARIRVTTPTTAGATPGQFIPTRAAGVEGTDLTTLEEVHLIRRASRKRATHVRLASRSRSLYLRI